MTQFYRAFEDEHRGSHDVIKERLQVYLPFALPLLTLYPNARALDVGCGRGEWLETLVENGFDATGVDLDDGMLEACSARQLPAQKADALVYLQSMPNESFAMVTGFHIAEHISFDNLRELVSEAHRVLQPGGLLILETPNAENLIVGTQNFYLDPTHERPIPHMLLDFLARFCGFERSKLLRLQENPNLAHADSLTLMDVIGGTSPDYAIVAQKEYAGLDTSAFDGAFEEDYGLSMAELAHRYELTLDGKAEKQRLALEDRTAALDAKTVEQHVNLLSNQNLINARVDAIEQTQLVIESQLYGVQKSVLALKLEELKLANASLQRSLDETHKNAHHWYTEAEERQQHIIALRDAINYKDQAINALSDNVQQLKSSTSWRITAPMRKSVTVTKVLMTSPSQATKRIVRALGKRALKHKSLIKIAKKILQRFPTLNAHARKLAVRLQTEAAFSNHGVHFNEHYSAPMTDASQAPAPPAQFTENAKAIYNRLNSNVQRKEMN
ncbi:MULTISPECIES: class I SAM-dependent methyltransferase [unclassified Pseudomonas]|uniref:class I SAM-dependent methyltransferase n=1 Tax=unclassified Pseudomonas TaxID=196821 RepID=UPI003801D3A2